MIIDLTDEIVQIHLALESSGIARRQREEGRVYWEILDRPRLWAAMCHALGADRAKAVGDAMATRPEPARVHALLAALEPGEILALGDCLQ